uniref:Intradiol ring-cleavage dioxygenases domain-containing protein n=1 Tax=Globisporangium ultimum (strain ATCC 200006 / CBS 805.95 / DAOM BR144) TaxID=431595 RepID=K3XCP3_GLOUD
MVQFAAFLTATALATLALVTTHPGQHHAIRTDAEIIHRKLFRANAHRSLKACANSPHLRKLKEQTVARRTAKAEQLRQEQPSDDRLHCPRDEPQVQSHQCHYDTDTATLFGTDPSASSNSRYAGPYYVSGELIRTDIREEQAGIDLYAELQIIDVNTCTAVENMYVTSALQYHWRRDTTNIGKTFNRGLAPTDSNGVVSFTTTFPGHYTGRASHIHVLGSHDGTVLANKTYSGGKAAHVGQIFFDQDLITEVEATSKYAVNTQAITLNSADSIFSESAASGFDPIMEYVLLGDSVEDGIFAWISIGVDTTISKTVSAVATLTAII